MGCGGCEPDKGKGDDKTYFNNIIHASASKKDAEREIRLWGRYFWYNNI